MRQSRRFYRVASAPSSAPANRARIPCVSRLFTPLSAFLTSPAGNQRLHSGLFTLEYENLSAANDAAGIRSLGLELYRGKVAVNRRYGIGLLYVAASMGDAKALRTLSAMYSKGTKEKAALSI